MASLTIRCWTSDDRDFLWEVLYLSLQMPDGVDPFRRSVLSQPAIAHYLTGFGERDGDDAVVAVEGDGACPTSKAAARPTTTVGCNAPLTTATTGSTTEPRPPPDGPAGPPAHCMDWSFRSSGVRSGRGPFGTVPAEDEGSIGVVEAAFNPVAAAPEHFIRELDLGVEESAGGSTARAEIGDLRCDAGLVATIVDVVGGHLALQVRAPAFVATTHIELHGIDRLHGPGELVAEARIIGTSKRRVITEVSLHLDGVVALAHAGFAIRADPSSDDQRIRAPRAGLVVDTPLWERIGVEDAGGGARVQVVPFIHNHVGALQGGAMMSLLERAALLAAGPGHVISDATINYLVQARAPIVRAVVTADLGAVVGVDGIGDGFETANARAVFRLRAG